MRDFRGVVVLLAAGLAVGATGPRAGEIAAADKRSSFDLMSPSTQAMQRDDSANPGMLWVLDGEALWSERTGAANRSCADCHGDATASMKGVATRYPAYDPARQGPVDLQGRIDQCRTERQHADALAFESRDLLALTAFVARQSRGLPIEPPADPRLAPAREKGRALFEQRQGQMNLSCAQCHDENWGRTLGGARDPAGPHHRLSAIQAGVAGPGLGAAAHA